MRSSWTAVLIAQTWYLVDVCWSLKYFAGDEDAGQWQLLDVDGNIKRHVRERKTTVEERFEYNESYFLTTPHELIYSH